ncbi:RRP15-like protein [Nematostella vectensis]|uniref:RRP15-like protein n=1 Tax=Nematostella vectensis TaxID=45351 RepID=UPI00207776B0|nr:RRP15-like protein [Nematostella vectensis]
MAANKVEVQYSESEPENSDNASEDGDVESEGEENLQSKSRWADAMSQILNKPLTDNKPVILSKYQKGSKRKAEHREEMKKKKAKAQEKHAILEKDHIIPDKSNLDYDRNLVKIATRGVVKLFNAVSKHQKEMDTKLSKATTETKKTKVMESLTKSSFLDMLKRSSDATVTEESTETTKKANQKGNKSEKMDEQKSSNSWNILRDDFMMGAKLKDWDKEEGKSTELQDYELQAQGSDDDQSDESDQSDSS